MPMTKSELVEKLAARFPQLLLRDADIAVKTILDAMSDALADGHRIEIYCWMMRVTKPSVAAPHPDL